MQNRQLKGDFATFCEPHVDVGWLLVYRVQDSVITLTRTGSHNQRLRKHCL
ncbi:type II toxin-antitoxin system mRNA interferase toxin, RelE/StbE family [Bifidobacterium coryneforme]|uniref:type II toxin-antitoxin system mRNA interferase toxin, RelE/StbE family n=1 Tax=Bifidobacterium coryneforme TaxID=1687 RepID=UPI0009DFFE0A